LNRTPLLARLVDETRPGAELHDSNLGVLGTVLSAMRDRSRRQATRVRHAYVAIGGEAKLLSRRRPQPSVQERPARVLLVTAPSRAPHPARYQCPCHRPPLSHEGPACSECYRRMELWRRPTLTATGIESYSKKQEHRQVRGEAERDDVCLEARCKLLTIRTSIINPKTAQNQARRFSASQPIVCARGHPPKVACLRLCRPRHCEDRASPSQAS